MKDESKKNELGIPEGIIIKTEDPNLVICKHKRGRLQILNVARYAMGRGYEGLGFVPGCEFSNDLSEKFILLGVIHSANPVKNSFRRDMVFYCKWHSGKEGLCILSPSDVISRQLHVVKYKGRDILRIRTGFRK